MMQKAAFGAGCFWRVQASFDKVKGVEKTTVGYMGGTLKNPTYKDVCTDTTGHAEVVEILFDETQVSYKELLDVFWKIHDPTLLNRQGPGIGTQYRSIIFYYTTEQKQKAEASKHSLEQTKKSKDRIVTEIVPAVTFYPAEEYHQKYLTKHKM
jgi:peptide-methionine (S)-S-oxide reductase